VSSSAIGKADNGNGLKDRVAVSIQYRCQDAECDTLSMATLSNKFYAAVTVSHMTNSIFVRPTSSKPDLCDDIVLVQIHVQPTTQHKYQRSASAEASIALLLLLIIRIMIL